MWTNVLKYVMKQGAVGFLLFTLGFMSHAYLYKNEDVVAGQKSMVKYEKVIGEERDASAEFMHKSANDEDGPLAPVLVNYYDWLRTRTKAP